MKFTKLALATVAAFGLAGVAQADTYYVTDGLEGQGWHTPDQQTGLIPAPQTGYNDAGGKGDSGAVWFGGVAGDETAVLPYVATGDVTNAPAPASDKLPTVSGTGMGCGDYFLKVSNSNPLWRMLNAYSKVNNEWPTDFPTGEGIAVDVADPDYGTEEDPKDPIYNGGLFVDTLVQFTPSEDPPSADEGSKLIVWMNTNKVLCVTAGKMAYDAGWQNPRTDFETGTTLETNTWYRLTVSAFNDVCYAEGSGRAVHGFRVYIDGAAVVATTNTVDDTALAQAAFAPLDPITVTGNCYPEVLTLINAKKFFCSLDCATSKASLSAVGFKGEGLVDDIVVSDVDPFPVSPSPAGGIDFTLTWDSDVSAVWYSIDGGANKVNLTVVPAAAINLPSAEVGDQLIIGGTAADAWGSVIETTNTLAASGNDYTVTATAATTAGAAGVTDTTLAALAPAEIKAAFGNDVTPDQVNNDPYAGMAYDLGQGLGYITGDPELKIVDIAQNGDNWDIKVQVLATVKEGGENPVALSIDSNDSEHPKLRATLQIKAAATLADLEGATPAKKTIVYDATATDLTITVPAQDGQFFKAYIGPEQAQN